MKLYILKYGNQYFSKAYTDQKMAERVAEDFRNYTSKNYMVKTIELPFIGRSVCYVHAYYGYDYDYDGLSIFDRRQSSHIYSCTDMAKQDDLWSALMHIAQSDPSNYIIADNKISSRNSNGEEFIHGDCFQNRFNCSIRRIRVIKEEY